MAVQLAQNGGVNLTAGGAVIADGSPCCCDSDKHKTNCWCTIPGYFTNRQYPAQGLPCAYGWRITFSGIQGPAGCDTPQGQTGNPDGGGLFFAFGGSPGGVSVTFGPDDTGQYSCGVGGDGGVGGTAWASLTPTSNVTVGYDGGNHGNCTNGPPCYFYCDGFNVTNDSIGAGFFCTSDRTNYPYGTGCNIFARWRGYTQSDFNPCDTRFCVTVPADPRNGAGTDTGCSMFSGGTCTICPLDKSGNPIGQSSTPEVPNLKATPVSADLNRYLTALRGGKVPDTSPARGRSIGPQYGFVPSSGGVLRPTPVADGLAGERKFDRDKLGRISARRQALQRQSCNCGGRR